MTCSSLFQETYQLLCQNRDKYQNMKTVFELNNNTNASITSPTTVTNASVSPNTAMISAAKIQQMEILTQELIRVSIIILLIML